jgi:hypothetical protein
MGRIKAAIEAIRERKADVRSTLRRTDEALLRAARAMSNAEEAIQRTDDLLARRLAKAKPH